MLTFCPVCKSLLSIKKEGYKSIGYCSCGFKRTEGIELSSSEINQNKVGETNVVNQEDSEGFSHKCSKCGNNQADVTDLGEILNSEASVCLYKCRKCGNVDRETGRG